MDENPGQAYQALANEDWNNTYDNGPRLWTSQPKNAPNWWGVNTFTSNMATG